MKENHKTLLQAIIISTIVIALLWFFAFDPLLNPITTALQNDPQNKALGMNDDTFEILFLTQAMFGVVLVMFFLLFTLIFYFVIKHLKKRNI